MLPSVPLQNLLNSDLAPFTSMEPWIKATIASLLYPRSDSLCLSSTRASTQPKMEIGAVKKEIKSEQNRDILKREIKKITQRAKNIINFTLINKQIYVLRFCSKVVSTLYVCEENHNSELFRSKFPICSEFEALHRN